MSNIKIENIIDGPISVRYRSKLEWELMRLSHLCSGMESEHTNYHLNYSRDDETYVMIGTHYGYFIDSVEIKTTTEESCEQSIKMIRELRVKMSDTNYLLGVVEKRILEEKFEVNKERKKERKVL